MQIFYHPNFKFAYQTFSARIKSKAEKREQIFRQNPFDPRLKTHKLHGRLKHQWSFSVDQKHRIVFEFDGKDVIFLDIGDHDVYR